MDVNKDVSSDFLFCVLRPAKHKIRKATTSKQLINFNFLTGGPIISLPAGLNQTEIQKSLFDRGSTPISIISSEKGFVAQCKTQMLKENDNIGILSFGSALKRYPTFVPYSNQ